MSVIANAPNSLLGGDQMKFAQGTASSGFIRMLHSFANKSYDLGTLSIADIASTIGSVPISKGTVDYAINTKAIVSAVSDSANPAYTFIEWSDSTSDRLFLTLAEITAAVAAAGISVNTGIYQQDAAGSPTMSEVKSQGFILFGTSSHISVVPSGEIAAASASASSDRGQVGVRLWRNGLLLQAEPWIGPGGISYIIGPNAGFTNFEAEPSPYGNSNNYSGGVGGGVTIVSYSLGVLTITLPVPTNYAPYVEVSWIDPSARTYNWTTAGKPFLDSWSTNGNTTTVSIGWYSFPAGTIDTSSFRKPFLITCDGIWCNTIVPDAQSRITDLHIIAILE